MHEIDVKAGLLAPNDAIARENRHLLAEHELYAVNLMSAPGSGKTSLLEWMLPLLAERYRVGVVEGDIVGSADKERLDRFGVPGAPDQHRRRVPSRRAHGAPRAASRGRGRVPRSW